MQVDLNQMFKFSNKVNFSNFSKKIGISENQIIDLLINSGFDNVNESTIYLNEEHLNIVSKAYIKSVKSYYNSSSKNYFKFDNVKQKEIRIFFSRFINKGLSNWNLLRNENTLDDVLGGKLDAELIKYYFDKLVNDIQIEEILKSSFSDFSFIREARYTKIKDSEDERIFNKHKHFINFKIKSKNLFNDIRSELQSILICCHYYIFSDEEDHRGEVNAKTRFSRFMIIPREALKIIYHLKFRKKWKKTLAYS